MKRYCFLLLVAVTALACRNKQAQSDIKNVDVQTRTFMVNSDSVLVDTLLVSEKDTAFVIKPKVAQNPTLQENSMFEINVLFSNKKWPALNFKQAIGADLFLVDDLDGDNMPELLLRPEWFSSCWSSINLFSLKDNAWKLVKKGSMYYCADEYPLAKRLEEKENKYYLLTDSLADDKFIINKSEIKF
ncbi:hypothetical protein [Pedobacter sp. SL55]|uniref:hypothetical protein n=1 Tax=Pedobacter sp. SL55 TaxID=2995161 RepID=UPI002270CD13|nr:hypothetical protein [Pedobacter sp. SL55]WAC41245.1 hypothetical protein OVA16_02420 [Pedobacter sp. SL55]